MLLTLFLFSNSLRHMTSIAYSAMIFTFLMNIFAQVLPPFDLLILRYTDLPRRCLFAQ